MNEVNLNNLKQFSMPLKKAFYENGLIFTYV